MLEKKFEGRKSIVIGLLIVSLFALYNISGAPVLLYVGLGSLALCLIMMNNVDLFFLISFLIPSIMMIKQIGNSSAILSYYFLLVIIKYFLTSKMYGNIWAILFLFFSTITSLLYSQLELELSIIRTFLFFVYIISLETTGFFRDVGRKESIIYIYLLGIVANIIWGVIYYSALGMDLYGGLFGGIRNDRNYFSSILSFAIVLCLLMISIDKKRLVSLSVIAFTCLFFGVTSASRTFILSLVFSVIVLFSYIENPRTWKILLGLIVISVVVGIAFKDKIIGPLEYVLDRFGDDDVATGSYRTIMWQYYLKLLFSTPIRILFGNGPSTMYLGSIPFVEHNTIIQMLSTLGIAGSITLILAYFSVYSRFVQRKIKFFLFTPLFCVLFCHSLINALFALQFDFAILISILVITVQQEKEKNMDL